MKKTIELATLVCAFTFVASGCDGADAPSVGEETVGETQSALYLESCRLPRASATASANYKQAPANAIDGKTSTRWESAFADNQFISVDLGKTQPVFGVELIWENACGKDYDIDTAPAATGPWTNQIKVRNNTLAGGVDHFFAAGVNARFVRMNGLKRCTAYGFSLYELAVYSGLQTCLADQDGDGFGADASVCGACPAAPAQGGDCNDANASVRPNQAAFFSTPISGTNWDYNCSKAIEIQSTSGAQTVCTNMSGVKQSSCATCAYQFAPLDASDCGQTRCSLNGGPERITCH